jgi:ribosomal protein S18 acetylase RimI-like enzyme
MGPEEMNSSLLIRPRCLDDEPKLQALDTRYTTETVFQVRPTGLGFQLEELPVPQFSKQYSLELEGQPSLALVAVDETCLLGYAEAWLDVWNRRLRLEHLYVEMARRGEGVGRALLDEVRRRAPGLGARGIWLETQNVNPGAVRFYLAQGFTLCGWDESLYDPNGPAAGETALFFYQAC